MKTRHLGLFPLLMMFCVPSPAQAQGDFIKDKVKTLIERSGVYVSVSTRTAIDSDVNMGPSIGIGYGLAKSQPRTGRKFPFSFSAYSGDLETSDGNTFGRIKAKQLMSGVGYQWVRGKMIYAAQVGLGYSFNSVALDPGVAVAFGVPEPVSVSVTNSFVVRPQVKAEYFVHRKVSLRTQLSYTYTDPDVVVHTPVGAFDRDWEPHHVQVSFAVGVFPFRK